MQAIARLVSGAVDELKPEDVRSSMRIRIKSLNVPHDGPMGGEGLEASLTQRLISTLEPIVGAGNIRASVNVDYDQGSSEESQEKYDPTVSALLSDQKSEDQAGGGAVTGRGSGSREQRAFAQASASRRRWLPPQSATQLSTTENARYGVNRRGASSGGAGGQVQRVSAAILVDDAVVKDVAEGKVTLRETCAIAGGAEPDSAACGGGDRL